MTQGILRKRSDGGYNTGLEYETGLGGMGEGMGGGMGGVVGLIPRKGELFHVGMRLLLT